MRSTPSRWLQTLPKVELHLHLEGSMSAETVGRLCERHDFDPTLVWTDGLPERFSFVDFNDFALQFFFGLSLLRTPDDIVTIIDDLAATLASQNVRYAEVTTTAFTHFLDTADRRGLTPAEYRDALNEGRRRASERGVELGWVIDIPRSLELPEQQITIDYLEGAATPDGLVGIGLGGNEVGCPAATWTEHFGRARALGLRSLPHAGETWGAESVRSAVDDLRADRIGHGIRCLEDPTLVRDLVERGVMLEVCPTSNHLLGVVPSIDDHPLPHLVDAGLRVSINTDDPGWFATDLVTELEIAGHLLGDDRAAHIARQHDTLAASYAPDATRAAIAAELANHSA